MPRRVFGAIVLSLLAAMVACTDSSTTMTPSSTILTVDGTWKTGVTVQGQAATMTWALTQTSTAASGTVTVSLPTGTVLMNGLLAGTVSNSAATAATLVYTVAVGPAGIPSQPACSGQFGGTMNATAAATTTMTGNFAVQSSSCTAPFPGTNLTMTKQ